MSLADDLARVEDDLDAANVPAEVRRWEDEGAHFSESQPEAEKPPWNIAHRDEAEWAMRKLADAEALIAEANAARDARLARIVAWADHVTAAPKRKAEFFRGHLERYALHLRAKEGTKTLLLPSGKVSTREPSQQQVVAYEDQGAYVAWALVHRPDVLVPKAPPLADLRASGLVCRPDGTVADAETGDIVPGLVAVRQEPTASVKPEPS